jgi:hypothetical protein
LAGVLRLASRLKDLKLGREIDMAVSIRGIDIAKNTFQHYDADIFGKASPHPTYRLPLWSTSGRSWKYTQIAAVAPLRNLRKIYGQTKSI